jgi:molybdopterin-guanine dinucleotide biosynthesis protein A
MTALYGLVLAGGRSSRMQADKAALAYGGQPALARAYALLAARVARAFVSVRADQRDDPLRAGYPQIVDGPDGAGPIAGIAAAQAAHPGAAWLVLACDLPLLDGATLDQLLAGRNPGGIATAFRSAWDGLPEPLCAIYEPASREPLLCYIAAGHACPRKFLAAHGALLLDAADPRALDNANTPQDAQAARAVLASAGTAG